MERRRRHRRMYSECIALVKGPLIDSHQCLVLAPVLTAAFIFWERYMGDQAMVPLAIFKRGLSIYSICSFAIFNRFIYLIFTYVRFVPVALVGQPLTFFHSIFVRRVPASPTPNVVG